MSECVHTDVLMLRCAQLEYDEIAVLTAMASEGRCPSCEPEDPDRYAEYVRRVRAARGEAVDA
jgi:hypothetical protein